MYDFTFDQNQGTNKGKFFIVKDNTPPDFHYEPEVYHCREIIAMRQNSGKVGFIGYRCRLPLLITSINELEYTLDLPFSEWYLGKNYIILENSGYWGTNNLSFSALLFFIRYYYMGIRKVDGGNYFIKGKNKKWKWSKDFNAICLCIKERAFPLVCNKENYVSLLNKGRGIHRFVEAGARLPKSFFTEDPLHITDYLLLPKNLPNKESIIKAYSLEANSNLHRRHVLVGGILFSNDRLGRLILSYSDKAVTFFNESPEHSVLEVYKVKSSEDIYKIDKIMGHPNNAVRELGGIPRTNARVWCYVYGN